MSILMNWSHIAISKTDALFEIFGSFLSYPLLFKQIWEYDIFSNTPNFVSFFSFPCHHCGLGASLVAQLVRNLPAVQETPVWLLGGENPLEKG